MSGGRHWRKRRIKGRNGEGIDRDRESDKSKGWKEQRAHGQWGFRRQRKLIKIIMWQVGVQLTDSGLQVNMTIFFFVNVFFSVKALFCRRQSCQLNVCNFLPSNPWGGLSFAGRSVVPRWWRWLEELGPLPLVAICPLGMYQSCQSPIHTDHPRGKLAFRASQGCFHALLPHCRIMVPVPCWEWGSSQAHRPERTTECHLPNRIALSLEGSSLLS